MTTLLVWLGILAFLYGVVALGFKLYRKYDLKTNRNQSDVPVLPLWGVGMIVGVLLFILGICIVQVPGQQVGVVFTPKGISNEPLHSGWHFVAPWNKVFPMDKTVWVYTFAEAKKEGNKADSDAIWAPTADGFKLGYDLSVTWRIDPNQAAYIYQNVSEQDGSDTSRYKWIEENIIRSYTKSALTSITKNYTVIEGYSTKRDEIQTKTFEILNKEMKTRRLILEAVNIREVHYNTQFETAINNKKLAEQEALRLVDVTRQKTELLIQSKIEKDIAIQEAQGKAEALRIKGNAINSNPKIIQLEWIQQWDGKLPNTIVGDSKGILLNMNAN